jgi:hypothetical protein
LRLGRFRAVAYFAAMRMGGIVSAVAHAGVVAWVLMGVPKPFAAAPGDVVNVDIVTPEEARLEDQKRPEPEKPKPKPEPEKPLLIPPRPDKVTEKPTNAVPSAPASSPAQASAPQAPAKATPAQPRQQPAPAPNASQPQRSAAARPASPAASPPPPAAPPAPAQADPSIFDAASIPKLADIAPPPPGPATVALGYDSAADATADSGHREAASLVASLKKCMRLPAGVDPARDLRVVVRVFLKPDGALASDPMLVSGPAVSEGPALVRAATQALKQCQPYALPPEKYQDWKMMDLTLRPRDMTGG